MESEKLKSILDKIISKKKISIIKHECEDDLFTGKLPSNLNICRIGN